MPVTDVMAGALVDLSPAYLEAVSAAAAGASAILLAEPYLLPVIERLSGKWGVMTFVARKSPLSRATT